MQVAATDAHEGPVYVEHEDALYFTTLPDADHRVAIRRLEFATGKLTTLRDPANVANGMTLGSDGRLVVCEQGTFTERAAITAIDTATGEREVLADTWRGLPFNSPNDVVVKSDGSIWFTDPSYGHLQGFRPEPQADDNVYRLAPGTNEVTLVADGFDKPNGLAFSPGERTLYVGDNGAPNELLAFDVDDGARLTGRRRLAVLTPEHPDGIKVDRAGRVYCSFAGGIQIFEPTGEPAGEIDLPGAVNFAFGRDVLFITADTAIWAATQR